MMTLMLKLNKSVSIAIILFAYWRILHAANYPPRFIQQPPKNAVYNIREALKLPCVAVAEPSARYKWIKNGKEFNPAANDKRYTQWPNEGTLIFAIPEQDDDGIYQCVAYNQFGEAYSVRTNLRRANINSFKSRPDDVRHVREGQSLTLFCTVPNSYPPPVVRWMVEKKETIEYIKETNRRAVDIDGNLRIAKIESESDNGAKYFCTANNVVMRVQKDSHKTEIQVINTTPMVQQVRKMYSSPTYQTAIIGDELSIRCIFSGSPLPQIAWQKRFPDGTRIPVNEVVGLEIRHTGTELFFRNVTKENEGFYLCTGTNEVTELSHYVEFNVKTQSKPVWVKKPVDQTVRINESVTFECEGNGDIEPRTVWLANGKPIQHYLDGVRRKMEGNKIVVENVTLNDNAVFQCNISNPNGYIYTNAYLNVIRMVNNTLNPESREYGSVESEFALSISQDPPEEIFGNRVVLQAKVTPALTNASYTWMFQGRIVSNRSIHIIKLFQNSDQGIYTCKVIGQNPRTSSNISLTAAIVTKDYKRASFEMQPGSGIVIYVKEKDNLRLLCNRKATEDRSQTKWKFLRKTLESSDILNKRMNRSDNSDVSTLILTGIEISQEGLYQCEVGNKSLSAIVKIIKDENLDNSENTPSSGKDANTIVKPASPKQLDRLNFAIDDQNRILAQIRDHLKEFVNAFKQAPFMKKDSDDLK